ncbi:MAG: single-stranded DNA-binding protein [Gemmataceae bacterium]
MANLNKVMLIGCLTRDPESRMFANGGKVTKFGFAVNNRAQELPDRPVGGGSGLLDVEAFNRGDFGKTADHVEQYLRKGSQAFIEGHLVLDQWTATDGQKRSKLKVVVDVIQFLDSRPADGSRPAPAPQRRPAGGMPDDSYDAPPPDVGIEPPPSAGRQEDIPF